MFSNHYKPLYGLTKLQIEYQLNNFIVSCDRDINFPKTYFKK